ncbi:hypothetical protein ASJ81_13910 [Methanosarcina spelaei]|uniref:Uncharacterized protein n=1 Tax=Methanosarcina spelaei TaxID=1036679 RepID=A0A2A2HYB6_9EURY|nr:hypothetical protein [Methanosarcina spelaei]PAV14417.1 hypothetical protein ASJ81_13910 [Methanosarcina spelaei]
MKAEIDVLLRDPCKKIDLALIESSLERSNLYNIIHKVSGNYLLLSDNFNNYKIRVHEDGRIYVRKDYGSEKECFDENLVRELINGLKKFLYTTKFLSNFTLQNEINFSFSGKKAYGYFWKKYSELNSIGEEYFSDHNLRTYTSDSESIYIKLEPVSPISEHACVNLFCI